MPYFCHQVSYTKEVFAHLMNDPQDRLEIVRAPIEKLATADDHLPAVERHRSTHHQP